MTRWVDPPDVSCSARTPHGSIALVDGVLLLRDDVDTELCAIFRQHRPDLVEADCLDARRVTFMGCPGLALMAGVARRSGTEIPLWASPAVLRPLQLTGLHTLFDTRD